MYNLYAHIKKDKVVNTENRSRRNALPLISLETVDEDKAVSPSSPRFRSHSDAFTSQSHPLHSPLRRCFDTVDSKFIGESLPRSYRRSERRIRALNTQLLEAIKCKDNFKVQRILDQGANPNATCSSEYISACHLAALAGGDALSLLQAQNAQMMRTDRFGRTPLHFAAWGGNIVQIAILLNIPAGILNKIKHHLPPDIAEEIRSINSTFQDLVNVRCELGDATQEHSDNWLDSIDHNRSRTINLPLLQPGWTPLHAASANARHECVKLLLAAGSDPNVRDFVGRSALDVAGFAYYGGLQINPNDFAEVIKLLLHANLNHSNINIAKILNTPLHTAVEVESIEAITELLAAGASVFTLNRDGLTPMHLCVKKKLKEHLQVLVHSHNDIEKVTATIDALDKDGRTVLHTAVLENWTPGVCIALEAGANISAKANDGETPIHLAATLGYLDILSEILNGANIKKNIDCLNAEHETALFKAVLNGHIDCVKILLKEGASITVTMPKQINYFHVAARLGFTEILKFLLDYDYAVTRIIINFETNDRADGKGFGPIHYAVWNNHPDCVKLLLSKNAYVSLKTIHDGSTPLHLAAMKNNLEIAKILVKFDTNTVHSVNYVGWTPLHTACRHKSREVILFLLSKGSNLGAITIGPDKFRKTAIDMIMNNLSKPTEFMEEVFDSYIYSNNLNLHDPNCEVTVDYSILHIRSASSEPHSDDVSESSNKICDIRQTTVIEAIVGTGNRQKQNRLLVHPLIESFLYFKWRALLPFFYMIILVYSAFVISLTVVILSSFFYSDKNQHIIPMLDPKAWTWVTLATLIILIPHEACCYKFSQRYFRQLETWIKLTTIFLALVLITNCNIGVAPDQIWYRHVATMALLLSWVELMFLLSGFPKWGYYVPMFRKVSSNVLKILMTFIFVIIGFSLSFMIEFHAQEPFENPFAALVKTMVMMTSEFDYDDLIKNTGKSKHLTPSLLTIRIIFIGFLIFTAIVLMNLMVGVAVNDLQNLELLGNIRRIKKQLHFLAFLENLSNYMSFHRFLPTKVLEKLTVKEAITLFPSEQTCEYYSRLPAHIRDAIFHIAQAKKHYTDKEFGTQRYNKKLDEIHKVIVTRHKHDKDTASPIAGVNKKQEENDQLESLVSELKNKLDLYFEQTHCSIKLLHTKTDGIIDRLDNVRI